MSATRVYTTVHHRRGQTSPRTRITATSAVAAARWLIRARLTRVRRRARRRCDTAYRAAGPGAIRCSGSNSSLTARSSASDGTGPCASVRSRTSSGAYTTTARDGRARRSPTGSARPAPPAARRRTGPPPPAGVSAGTLTSRTPATADPVDRGIDPAAGRRRPDQGQRPGQPRGRERNPHQRPRIRRRVLDLGLDPHLLGQQSLRDAPAGARRDRGRRGGERWARSMGGGAGRPASAYTRAARASKSSRSPWIIAKQPELLIGRRPAQVDPQRRDRRV